MSARSRSQPWFRSASEEKLARARRITERTESKYVEVELLSFRQTEEAQEYWRRMREMVARVDWEIRNCLLFGQRKILGDR